MENTSWDPRDPSPAGGPELRSPLAPVNGLSWPFPDLDVFSEDETAAGEAAQHRDVEAHLWLIRVSGEGGDTNDPLHRRIGPDAKKWTGNHRL